MSDAFDSGSGPGGSVVDEVTGLPNALGWQSLLDMEERRCQRYGGNPAVVLIEVEGLVPEVFPPEVLDEEDLARLVAEAVARTSRETDAVARVGDRSYAVLATESGESVGVFEGRLRLALEVAGVVASVRARSRRPWSNLGEAWRQLQSAATASEWVDPPGPLGPSSAN